MKKNFFWILLLLLPFLCMGAKFNALIDDDKGHLLYDSSLETVWVYQKSVEGKKWACIPFRGNKVVKNVTPGDCILLNCYEDDLDPDVIVLQLAYWVNRNSRHWHGYYLIAKKMNSEKTNRVRSFFAELSNYCRSLRSMVNTLQSTGSQVTQSSCASSGTVGQLLQGTFNNMLQGCGAVKHVRDAIKDKNFFLAFCLYRIIWVRALSTIPSYSYSLQLRNSLRNELLVLGEEVRREFLQARGDNQNRELTFKKNCGNKHGGWEYAAPINLSEMWKKTQSCYDAFRKTQSLSPYSEYPDWGSAMLEVLQMIKNQKWEQQFDKASSEYQKNNNI